MREIVSYQAIDGRLFNSKNECAAYEAKFFAYRTEISVSIEFFDCAHQKIDRVPTSEEEYFAQRLEDAYNWASYLTLHDDLSDDAIKYLQEEMGWRDFPTKQGEYRYDEETSEKWVKITDDFINFCKKWGLTTREMIRRFTP